MKDMKELKRQKNELLERIALMTSRQIRSELDVMDVPNCGDNRGKLEEKLIEHTIGYKISSAIIRGD